MEEPHLHVEVVVGVTDISMLVTLNGAAFVVIMLVSLFAVTTLVREARLAADEADVVALPPWLPIPFPHPATPNTRKHTTMTNVLLVLLLLHIETPLFSQYESLFFCKTGFLSEPLINEG